MTDRLLFTKNGKDIEEGIELRNGKANPFGWSTYEVWLTEHGGETLVEYCIGTLYCGEPKDLIEGIGYRIQKDID